MAILRGKVGSGETSKANKDIYETLLRMALSLLANYLLRRFKIKQELKSEGRKAGRKAEKLAAKGLEVPAELEEEAVKGLSRRQKKLVDREKKEKEAAAAEKKKAEKKKAAKKKAAKKKGRKRLFFLFLLGLAVAAAVRASKK